MSACVMPARTETFLVTEHLVEQRLDTFLRSRFVAVSRESIRRLIEQGEIKVNGRKVKPSHRPVCGENIEVHWPAPKSLDVQPEEIPLQILHEDESLLVLDKDSGLVIHPAAGHEAHTLVNGLLHHCRGELSGIGGVARPGIVHRLDKETSGCLVVAKTDLAHIGLAKQFEERKIEKVYEALVCGHLVNQQGDIRAAIARHPSHRKRMAVTEGQGREAWTTYRVLDSLNGVDHVEALLHTGRTHQIRVHFQHLGNPVAGDSLYGNRQNTRLHELTGCVVPRVMLHARTLGFTHPRTNQRMMFNAPLPADFQAAIQALKAT